MFCEIDKRTSAVWTIAFAWAIHFCQRIKGAMHGGSPRTPEGEAADGGQVWGCNCSSHSGSAFPGTQWPENRTVDKVQNASDTSFGVVGLDRVRFNSEEFPNVEFAGNG